MSKTAMPDGEVKSRLEAIERYNDYFRRETDEKGNSLKQHVVGPDELWKIMTREWGIVDPTKFGVAKPPEPCWPPKKDGAKAVASKPENLSDGL